MELVVEKTIDRLFQWLKGEEITKVDDWFEEDKKSYGNFIWLTGELARNGFVDVKTDWEKYVDDESVMVCELLYQKADSFFRR